MGYGKRGMVLEKMIDYTNNVYRQNGKALINKVPTPWNVSYDKRSGRVIRAFPEKKGTVDFVGVSHGRAIAFDTKNTKERTRFPLSNIEQHQVDYLNQYEEQGGIGFLIIAFEKHNETYLLPIRDLNGWWKGQFNRGRKSIPYAWFKLNVRKISSTNGVPLDYLKQLTLYPSDDDRKIMNKRVTKHGKN